MNNTINFVQNYPKEEKIWLTSDLHIGHNQEFVWKARGFKSVHHMNDKLLENLYKCVKSNDKLFILGDLTLGDLDEALPYLTEIPGEVHVILGNHDTERRIALYQELNWRIQWATKFKYDKIRFYLSHYPTLTANPGEDFLSLATINLFGHTHQTYSWSPVNRFGYNVGVDAHNNCPVNLANILDELREHNKTYSEYMTK